MAEDNRFSTNRYSNSSFYFIRKMEVYILRILKSILDELFYNVSLIRKDLDHINTFGKFGDIDQLKILNNLSFLDPYNGENFYTNNFNILVFNSKNIVYRIGKQSNVLVWIGVPLLSGNCKKRNNQ